MPNSNLTTLGWCEWVSLPDLGVSLMNAKIDTGARTSSLHASCIETYYQNGSQRVKFKTYTKENDSDIEITCDAEIFEERIVTNSGGYSESRFIIKTTIIMGHLSRIVEITLADRDTMKFNILIGRTTLNGYCLVNPIETYLIGKPSI